MKEELAGAVKAAVQELFNVDVEVELTRPDEQFGDYSTNVALQLAGRLNKNPREIAEAIAAKISGATVAGAGFINIAISDEDLAKAALGATDLPKANQGKEILVEFGDPNPFKQMHIGHAYSYIVGDAISSILEASGAKVERLSYHGDVGRHVARAIYGIKLSDINYEDSSSLEIGSYYALGAKADEQDAEAKAKIDEINQKIYDKSDPEINKIYEWGKQASFEYFDSALKDLGVRSARRFLESQSAEKGIELVQAHPEVFEQSEGAIVYKGEKAGLHTRVFITSAGLPTYEAKDLGLAELKKEAYPGASRSIIITAHEQAEYFKVMLAALREFDAPTADITTHLYHGFISLSTGKMSSRTGEVYGATDLINDVDEAVQKTFGQKSSSTRNAAIKYGFLKNRLGSDIIYDVAESLSLEGSSGPYLQYAHARACSILSKAEHTGSTTILELDESERSLARKISQYPDVVATAIYDLAPSHICTYLYELAQSFNRFYEKSRVIGDPREVTRLALVKSYRDVLASGLKLLNIEAPEKI